MWLLREAELTRLKTVTATLNSPVLQRVKHTHAISPSSPSKRADIHFSSWGFTQHWRKHRPPHGCNLQPGLLLEDVLLCAPSRPRRPVSEIPQEAHITSCADPAVHRHRTVQQDGRLVPQTVESHRVLDDQREDIGAHPGPTSWWDQNHIVPGWSQKEASSSAGSQSQFTLSLCLQPARFGVFFSDAPWGGPGPTGVPKVPEEVQRAGILIKHGQESHLSVGGISFLLCMNLYCVEPEVVWFLFSSFCTLSNDSNVCNTGAG